uniref:tRNA (guanine(37)-N1)-methyltransferase n=1 Tax=Anopheles atroparvus TaxID=41427 RepID=A0A182IV32_ANOAO
MRLYAFLIGFCLRFHAAQACSSQTFDFVNHFNPEELDLSTPPDTVIASFLVENVNAVFLVPAPVYIGARLVGSQLTFFTTANFSQYEEHEVQLVIILQVTYTCATGQKNGIYRQNIKEANNHAPRFLEEAYRALVPLPLPKYFDVSPYLANGAGVMARDIDLVNNTVQFSLSNNDYFTIESHPVTGDVKQFKAILRLREQVLKLANTVELIVTATDRGVPPKASQAIVTIEPDLSIVYDDPPEFKDIFINGTLEKDAVIQLELIPGTETKDVQYTLEGSDSSILKSLQPNMSMAVSTINELYTSQPTIGDSDTSIVYPYIIVAAFFGTLAIGMGAAAIYFRAKSRQHHQPGGMFFTSETASVNSAATIVGKEHNDPSSTPPLESPEVQNMNDVTVSAYRTHTRQLFVRLRHYFKNMLCPDLHPPANVRGMTRLDRQAFNKTIKVPHLIVPKNVNLNNVCRVIKKYLLKMERYKPVVSEEYKITLHPLAVQRWEDLAEVQLEEMGFEEKALVWQDIELGYVNWKYDEIFKAVLPADKEALSSFSKIGHIVHLNLKDHLLPYRELIGAVIIDKIADCRTVVNKSVSIDNTYRNFQMELLCGDPDYQVSVKENGCAFKFDFSKVYWNPRLSTEHEKLVKMLTRNDILYDLYAGVGPFTVPAARKGCTVLSNDLNPDSYQALVENCAINKVTKNVKCFNKDAVDFIKQEVKQNLLEKCADETFKGVIHISMNLPALAVEHLQYFPGLLNGENMTTLRIKPLVHVYCFAKGADDKKQIAQQLVERWLGTDVEDKLKEIAFVRNVAPNKDMMRVSFYLTEDLLLGLSVAANKRHLDADDMAAEKLKRPCNLL